MRKNQFYEAKITVLAALSIMLLTIATISPAESYAQGQYQSGNIIYIDESSPFHENSKYLNPYKYKRMNMSNAPHFLDAYGIYCSPEPAPYQHSYF